MSCGLCVCVCVCVCTSVCARLCVHMLVLVKGNIYTLLGVLAEVYPVYVIAYSERLVSLYISALKAEVCAHNWLLCTDIFQKYYLCSYFFVFIPLLVLGADNNSRLYTYGTTSRKSPEHLQRHEDTFTSSLAQTHIHTHTHTQRHTHKHTHTHMHTHTLPFSLSLSHTHNTHTHTHTHTTNTCIAGDGLVHPDLPEISWMQLYKYIYIHTHMTLAIQVAECRFWRRDERVIFFNFLSLGKPFSFYYIPYTPLPFPLVTKLLENCTSHTRH